ELPPPPAEAVGLDVRLAALDKLKAAGRWGLLAEELDTIEAQAAAAGQRCRDTQQAAAALLDRRNELRGLLDAYQIKAARLGAAEDSELSRLYDQAHELLWTAPCDLAAAAAAGTRYQQATRALSGGGRSHGPPPLPSARSRAAAGPSKTGTARSAGWPPPRPRP